MTSWKIPWKETPGWHGSEDETAEVMAFNESLVHLVWTDNYFTHAPKWLDQNKFKKINGSPYVIMRGLNVAWVPMDHQEYSDTGLIGNPFRATAEKGKLIQRKAEILAEFCEELKKVEVEVHNRDYTGEHSNLRLPIDPVTKEDDMEPNESSVSGSGACSTGWNSCNHLYPRHQGERKPAT